MTATVGIWQIFYQDAHQARLDPAFTPLDNRGYADEALEFAVFQRLAAGAEVAQLDYWGALSWRFRQKTGLTGAALLETVQAQPDVDVFYMNPFPYIEALFPSPWWHGEVAHPDFLQVSEAVFLAAGLPMAELHRLTPAREFSVCNYFVGRLAFWAAYLPFVEAALAQADAAMPPALCAKLHSADADWKGIHHAATYVPFIVERLFTVFLRTAGRHLRVHKIPSPAGEERLDTALRNLRETKDVAILTRSPRLLDRWQQRRRTYFEQHYGADWCRQYLELVMNAPVGW